MPTMSSPLLHLFAQHLDEQGRGRARAQAHNHARLYEAKRGLSGGEFGGLLIQENSLRQLTRDEGRTIYRDFDGCAKGILMRRRRTSRLTAT